MAKYVTEDALKTVLILVKDLFGNYVQKEDGKGLSTEDFTTELRTKLNGINLNEYYSKSEIDNALAAINSMSFVKVDSFQDLPQENQSSKHIYLVPAENTAENNVWNEVFWDGEKYDILGSTVMDLSGYLQKAEVTEVSSSEATDIWNEIFS